MEKKVVFPCGGIELEGLLNQNSSTRGVVITHPHPLYGGNMYNPVVEAISEKYHENGLTTLRFNFRGCGESQGVHDNGPGEQKDLAAAVNFLDALGLKKIDLAGYSFGAWIIALAVSRGVPADNLILISPPAAFIDFKDIINLSQLSLVITGDLDELAPVALLKKMVPKWNIDARLEIIKNADHFFSGYLNKLQKLLE